MVDIVERGFGESAHRLGLDHQHLAGADRLDPYAVVGEVGDIELAVGGGVLAERKQRRVAVGRERCGGWWDRGVH
jgi:hypothetical protein